MIIMTGGSVGLFIACAAFVTEEWAMFRKTTVEELTTLADIIGYTCAPTLFLDDREGAEKTLDSLKAKPHIDSACIYRPSNAIHARWIRPGAQATFPASVPTNDVQRFEGDHLVLFKGIVVDNEVIGTLYLRSGLTAIDSRLKRYAGIVILVLLASMLITWRVSSSLQGIISEPIFSLLRTAERVARDQDFCIRAQSHGEDELGLLVKGFNNMLAQIQARDTALQQAHENLERIVDERTRALKLEILEREQAERKLTALHRELLTTSRQAGMAEVATSVLHNVGNVLNSVNVSTILISERIRRSKTSNLRKIASLIQAHADHLEQFVQQDEKGQLIFQYLLDLAEHLDAEQKEALNELNSLSTNVEHIKEIVAMQQSYASVSGVIESLSITDLVEDALRMYASGFQSKGIHIERRYAPSPVVSVDKHRVLQIVANLIVNARDSVMEAGPSDPTITLEIAPTGTDRVRIAVCDNGVGIRQENLTRVFSHGFTTKKDGHGFGLHFGALAAQEMGGSLLAESDGEGKGARFILELPLVNRNPHRRTDDHQERSLTSEPV